jgi:hypothetical protein
MSHCDSAGWINENETDVSSLRLIMWQGQNMNVTEISVYFGVQGMKDQQVDQGYSDSAD